MKVIKKPIVVDAVRWMGDIESLEEIEKLKGSDFTKEEKLQFLLHEQLLIQTLEGPLTASLGDYIVKGVRGELYPVKPDIFEETYDIVSDQA